MAANDRSRLQRGTGIVVRSVLPVVFALIVGAIILWALGKNPLTFYGDIVENGLADGNWQSSMVLMSPLLIIGIALIVVFRGQLWNLGYDGQYLLGAVFAAGFGPALTQQLPLFLAYIVLSVGAIAVGAIWTLIPAWLKARYGTNEIITTLVMSTIGIGIANMLIKGMFQDPKVVTPQTAAVPVDSMLPFIPGTQVNIGFIVAIVVALAFHVILTRTSFGLRLDVFGSNPKAARHVGINSRWMVVVLFLISGGLIGLAASMDMLGQWGYLRANWNPSYGNEILPFVFLARLSPLASIPFIAFYSVFATGATIASQQAGLSVDFLMVIVALVLVFMTITEYVGTKRDLGQSYLPDELKDAIRKPFASFAERGAS
ncbi:MAG: ABC transporter permease [Microbacteriaceae bacterium]|nr:MAG: ABC transporter permease [Microbacteriaceae bacterium]